MSKKKNKAEMPEAEKPEKVESEAKQPQAAPKVVLKKMLKFMKG